MPLQHKGWINHKSRDTQKHAEVVEGTIDIMPQLGKIEAITGQNDQPTN